MRTLVLVWMLISSAAHGQVDSAEVLPKMTTAAFRSGATVTLRLSPGYVSAVHLPESVSSIAVGDPVAFHAEHSDAEPHLIFFKPVTAEPARSNAIVVTRNGTTLTLVLVSLGHAARSREVDFLLEWRRPKSTLIVGGSEVAMAPASTASNSNVENQRRLETNIVDEEMHRQADLSFSAEARGQVQVMLGRSRQIGRNTIVPFSVRNGSDAPIELLPPQMELTVEQPGKKRRLISDPLPVLAYRMSRRRLLPGERSDGAVVFERPASKATDARLELRLAQAAEADRPIVVAVPFFAALSDESDE